METALKEVFNVHRNVVRGLRSQLQQALQEKDDLKLCLDGKHKQLEEEVRKLRKETSYLLKAVAKYRCNKVLSDSTQDSQHEATRLLGKQLQVVEKILAVIAKERKEPSPCLNSRHSHNPVSGSVDENQIPEPNSKEDDGGTSQRESRGRQKEREATDKEDQMKSRQALNKVSESCQLSGQTDHRQNRAQSPQNPSECRSESRDSQRTGHQAVRGLKYHSTSQGDSSTSNDPDTHLSKIPLYEHHGNSPTSKEDDSHLQKIPLQRQQVNSPKSSDLDTHLEKVPLHKRHSNSPTSKEDDSHLQKVPLHKRHSNSPTSKEDDSHLQKILLQRHQVNSSSRSGHDGHLMKVPVHERHGNSPRNEDVDSHLPKIPLWRQGVNSSSHSDHGGQFMKVPVHRHEGNSPTGDNGDLHLSEMPFHRHQDSSPTNINGDTHNMETGAGDVGTETVQNTENKSPSACRKSPGDKATESGVGDKLKLARYSGKRKRYTENGVGKKHLKSTSGVKSSRQIENEDEPEHSPEHAQRPASRPSFLAPQPPVAVPATSPLVAAAAGSHCLVPDTCSTSFSDQTSPLHITTSGVDQKPPARPKVSVKTQCMSHNSSSTVVFVPETLAVDLSGDDEDADEDCGIEENDEHAGQEVGMISDTGVNGVRGNTDADMVKEADTKETFGEGEIKLKDTTVIDSTSTGVVRNPGVVKDTAARENASMDVAEEADELEQIHSPLSTSACFSQKRDRRNHEVHAKPQRNKTDRRPQLHSDSGGESQGVWATDSAVFGRTSLLDTNSFPLESTAHSLCLVTDEQAASSLLSPVFTSHPNKEAGWGAQSPALFDEEAFVVDGPEDKLSAASQDRTGQLGDVTLAPPAASFITTPSPCMSTPLSTSKASPASVSLRTTVPSASHVTAASRLEGRTPYRVSPASPSLLKPALAELRQPVPHADSSANTCMHSPVQTSALGVRTAGNAGHLSPIIVTLQREQNAAVLKPIQRRSLFKSKPLRSNISDNTGNGTLGGGEHGEMPSQVHVQQSSQLNASLDPDMRLTQYLQTMAEEQAESEADVTVDPRMLAPGHGGNSPPDANHLSQGGPSPTPHPGVASSDSLLDDSFDKLPQRKKEVSFAYAEVVRKQDERRKLLGFSCQECKQYYRNAGLSEAEMASRMAQCSRHRARQAPPNTPEHFWSVGFPDTQECDETE